MESNTLKKVIVTNTIPPKEWEKENKKIERLSVGNFLIFIYVCPYKNIFFFDFYLCFFSPFTCRSYYENLDSS